MLLKLSLLLMTQIDNKSSNSHGTSKNTPKTTSVFNLTSKTLLKFLKVFSSILYLLPSGELITSKADLTKK